MSLIIATGNPEIAIVVADRRVLSNGSLVEDGANDPFVVQPMHTRVGLAFTGLGRTGSFETRSWLQLALHSTLQPVGDLRFETLCLLGDQQWERRPSPADDATELTAVMAGFTTEDGERFPAVAIYSNWELPPDMDDSKEIDDRFRSVWWRHTSVGNFDQAYAVPAGLIETVMEEDIQALRALAASRPSHDELLARSIEIIRTAAARPEAEGRIGTDCVSISISPDPLVSPLAQLHMAAGTSKLGVPHVSAAGIEGWVGTPKEWREASCPCGNPKKYRYCHGR